LVEKWLVFRLLTRPWIEPSLREGHAFCLSLPTETLGA